VICVCVGCSLMVCGLVFFSWGVLGSRRCSLLVQVVCKVRLLRSLLKSDTQNLHRDFTGMYAARKQEGDPVSYNTFF
jgi:hypothetical protein